MTTVKVTTDDKFPVEQFTTGRTQRSISITVYSKCRLDAIMPSYQEDIEIEIVYTPILSTLNAQQFQSWLNDFSESQPDTMTIENFFNWLFSILINHLKPAIIELNATYNEILHMNFKYNHLLWT